MRGTGRRPVAARGPVPADRRAAATRPRAGSGVARGNGRRRPCGCHGDPVMSAVRPHRIRGDRRGGAAPRAVAHGCGRACGPGGAPRPPSPLPHAGPRARHGTPLRVPTNAFRAPLCSDVGRWPSHRGRPRPIWSRRDRVRPRGHPPSHVARTSTEHGAIGGIRNREAGGAGRERRKARAGGLPVPFIAAGAGIASGGGDGEPEALRKQELRPRFRLLAYGWPSGLRQRS